MCKLMLARADTIGFSLGFKTGGNKPVSNSLNINTEYMTASIITCNFIIKSHQSNVVNQCVLELETVSRKPVLEHRLVTVFSTYVLAAVGIIDGEGGKCFSDRKISVIKGWFFLFMFKKVKLVFPDTGFLL